MLLKKTSLYSIFSEFLERIMKKFSFCQGIVKRKEDIFDCQIFLWIETLKELCGNKLKEKDASSVLRRECVSQDEVSLFSIRNVSDESERCAQPKDRDMLGV